MIQIICDKCKEKYSCKKSQCPHCGLLTSENSTMRAEHKLVVNDLIYNMDRYYDYIMEEIGLYNQARDAAREARKLPWWKKKEQKAAEVYGAHVYCTVALKLRDVFYLTIEDYELYEDLDFLSYIIKNCKLPEDNYILPLEESITLIKNGKKHKEELIKKIKELET